MNSTNESMLDALLLLSLLTIPSLRPSERKENAK
jgi:hypothetical protein